MYGLKWFLCLLCLVLSLHSDSQIIDAAELEHSKNRFITKKVDLFVSLKDLPIDSIRRPEYAEQFRDIDREVAILSQDAFHYWFRFVL